jgi:hypothetical protein
MFPPTSLAAACPLLIIRQKCTTDLSPGEEVRRRGPAFEVLFSAFALTIFVLRTLIHSLVEKSDVRNETLPLNAAHSRHSKKVNSLQLKNLVDAEKEISHEPHIPLDDNGVTLAAARHPCTRLSGDAGENWWSEDGRFLAETA